MTQRNAANEVGLNAEEFQRLAGLLNVLDLDLRTGSGFELFRLYDKLMTVLEAHGLTPIAPDPDVFYNIIKNANRSNQN